MERWNYGTLRSRPLAAPTDGPCPATTAPGCTPEWMRQPDQFDGKQATPNLGKHPTQGQQLAPGLDVAEVGKVGDCLRCATCCGYDGWAFCGLSTKLLQAVVVLGSGNCIAQFSLFSC